MALSKMNDKPFTHVTMVKWPGHAKPLPIGRHTGEDEAFRNYYRNKLPERYSEAQIWVQDLSGNKIEIPDKSEVRARHRAQKNNLI